MWKITEGPTLVEPLADHHRYLYVIERGVERRELYTELSGTVAACAPETLPDPLGELVTTHGRAAVERYLIDDEPPAVVRVHTAGWQPVYRELSETRA
jgi:hypothetical protein